uniref:Gamma-glutamyltranspeptidase 1 n=1 Tax=Timema tahoe TaxID=61484 RepID=A0A7R9IMI6_9NEOP|nr:unnamed protein product [Timema tahoe]
MFVKSFSMKRPRVLVVCSVVLLALLALAVGLYFGLRPTLDDDTGLNPRNPTSPLPPSDSPMGVFWDASVATNGYPCAIIGRNILMKNGSATEAAIAALFCEGVACPQSMGLGGGFFMTIYKRATGKVYTLDSREVAPAAATENMFHGDSNLSQRGGLAVAVPGELKGYQVLFDHPELKSGNVDWRDLIEPTIKLCEEGLEVTPYLANVLQSQEESIKNRQTLGDILINNATQKVWQIGDKIRRPRLAKTLRTIISEGAEALYNGSLTKDFVKDIQDLGGIITEEDMANYSVKWSDPVSAQLRGNFTLHTMPLPGSGDVLVFMLNILNTFVPATTDVLTYHRIAESMKYAYGRRTELGDTDFVHNIGDLLKNMTSPTYAAQIRSQISDTRTWNDASHYGAVLAQPEDHGTANLCVLAPNGDAVAVTSTINLLFGAQEQSLSTGIILNDEMDDFSAPNITNAFGIPPSPNNFIQPGKRPLSSMVPSIVVDGEGDVRLVVGAAGGTKITTATAQVAMNNLWFNKTIKEAVDASRIHHQLFPMSLQYEYGLLEEYVKGLEAIGHFTTRFAPGGSTVTAISKEGGRIYSNSDFRRGGIVAGF